MKWYFRLQMYDITLYLVCVCVCVTAGKEKEAWWEMRFEKLNVRKKIDKNMRLKRWNAKRQKIAKSDCRFLRIFTSRNTNTQTHSKISRTLELAKRLGFLANSVQALKQTGISNVSLENAGKKTFFYHIACLPGWKPKITLQSVLKRKFLQLL